MTGQSYGNQLLLAPPKGIISPGGSSALNFGEAQGTNTDRDYVFKASICLKELKESRVNLKILAKVDYGSIAKRKELLEECEQLIRSIVTIIKNKK